MKKQLIFTLLCISLLFSSYAQIPTDGLIGHYKLNDGNLEDSSPSGLDLEAAGIGILFPADDRFGESDQALLFINEYLDLSSDPTAFNFDSNSNFSLCIWIEIGESVVDWTGLLNNWNGPGTGGYYLGLNPTQGVRWNVNGPTVIDSDAIPTGEWTHIAATYNGADSKLYIDGEFVASAANNTPIAASPLPFTVATQADLPTLQFPGILDDILVYDRELNSTEIEGIFTTLSVEGFEAFASKVKLYPNPTSANVNVSYDTTFGTIEDYKITDLQGRIIFSNQLNGNDKDIDLSGIKSGVYLATFKTVAGYTITKKLVKK